MSEYAYIFDNQIKEIIDLQPSLHAQWVATNNPKAVAYRPVFTDSMPSYNQATQAVDEKFTVATDRVTRGWTVRPKSADELRKIWTAYEFLKRFTWQERSAIRIAGFDDDAVADFLTLCTAAQTVVSDDPVTVAGMDYLVSLNLLTPARRAEILS